MSFLCFRAWRRVRTDSRLRSFLIVIRTAAYVKAKIICARCVTMLYPVMAEEEKPRGNGVGP